MRRRIAAAALAGCIAFTWFLPMIQECGGFAIWWSALTALWTTVPARETVFNSPIINSIARLLTIVAIGALCFGCALLLPLLQTPRTLPRQLAIFIALWITPGLLFFTFVFLKFVNSGYLLFLTPPLFALLGGLAAEWLRPGRRLAAAAALAVNVLIFLAAPVYCSWLSIRHFESELEHAMRALPKMASPADTVIVGFDSHFMGYRHAGYYLPAYRTVEYPAALAGPGPRLGPRLFVMHGRDTTLAHEPAAGYSRFVFFPLPREGRDYRDYVASLVQKCAPASLDALSRDGQAWISGPASALAALYSADTRHSADTNHADR